MKIQSFILFVAVSFSANAQIHKGSFLTSGGISYGHYKSSQHTNFYDDATGQWIPGENRITNNSLSFTPKVGYLFTSRICAGLSLPVSLTIYKYSMSGISSVNYASTNRSITIAPFVRYYFPVKSNLYALAEGSYGWSTSKNIVESDQKTISKGNSRKLQVGAGLAYLLNQHVGVELLGFYTAYFSEEYKTSDYLNLNVQLGLQVYLWK